jgi:hypothetical protein
VTRRTKRNLLIGAGIVVIASIAGLVIAARILSRRFEPYIREQAIAYLEKRFNSDVELRALHISMPKMSPLNLVMRHGHGTIAGVEGEGVSLRYRGNPTAPPMFVMKKFAFQVDLGAIFDTPKTVHSVVIDGMEINIPPKKDRPDFDNGDESGGNNTDVVIEEVLITDSMLRILPKSETKEPLEFELQNIRLRSAGRDVAMHYEATLTNAKPPGLIQSKGTFGPWAANEPGDSPVKGDYDFKDADLGVFDGIAGILHSTGEFTGTLDSLEVNGKADVPDFRLTDAGNRVPLSTTFNVLVDGTNGDTVLKPVVGKLGSTTFQTSGAIIKREKEHKRSIDLDVRMPNGDLRDLLSLAMKGTPFMEGRVTMHTRIAIPPLSGKVRQKLMLDGQFEINKARFLRSKIQDQIDSLSRRGQGKPAEESIVEVPSGMAGSFQLANEAMTFRSLSFAVPGAGVDLNGTYNLKKDELDFHGTLKLQARVSQTMTGWKRWVLKPIDPFFAKQGAGTLLRIQVVGTSKDPQFGRDKGKKEKDASR